MRLCFGTFVKVLNCHQQDIVQASLVARIARCVDKHSNYIAQDERFVSGWEVKGDESAVSKLCNCKKNFVFTKDQLSGRVAPDMVPENFKAGIAPLFSDDSKIMIILTLLYIIQNDPSIDSEKKESFKNYLWLDKQQLLQQKQFVFSDLLGRILVYTVYANVDNTVGKEDVESITSDYIKKIITPHIKKYVWEPTTETLTLSFGIMFNVFDHAMWIYQIDDFLRRVDPTNPLSANWIEMCEDFLKYVEVNIWEPFGPTGSDAAELMLQKIQHFSQTLDEYTSFLSYNMRPLSVKEGPDFLVPISYMDSRDELYFGKKVNDYRQQICDIYQDIFSHAVSAQQSSLNHKK